MKIRISELRKVVRNAIRENLKRNKSLLEALRKAKAQKEDVDRVRRNKDGYGDALEEAEDKEEVSSDDVKVRKVE